MLESVWESPPSRVLPPYKRHEGQGVPEAGEGERVREIGRARGVAVRVDTERGKGSHVTLYYGNANTIVKDRRKEIGPGLLSKMIPDLGLESSDFR